MSALPMPPSPAGSLARQVTAQYSYLFQMAQQLNAALTALDGSAAANSSAGASRSAVQKADETQQYNTLRSLIVKTADSVKKEMDTLTATLSGQYVAQSDFGTYVENLSAYLEANPEALTQYYSFAGDLKTNVERVDAAFSDYRTDTQGYIRTGIVSYDGATPVYGVAVGQNLRTTEVDGQQVVGQDNFRAVFTARRLGFWQDETEVAYVSDNRLYINNITVLSSLSVGAWRLEEQAGSLAFQWIGG